MLKKIEWYIVGNIVSSSLVVLLALQTIVVLIDTLSVLDDLGEHNFSIFTLIGYVLGYSSLKIIQLFPIALLLGSLLGLGKIAATNELTVMQFFGLSKIRIGRVGIYVSLVMGAIVLLANEFVFTPAYEKAVDLRQDALNIVDDKGRYGFWAQSGKSFVNIRGVKSNGHLAGVTIYTVDEQMRLTSIKKAQTAAYVDQPAKGWNLFKVSEKVFLEGGNEGLAVKIYPKQFWENTLDKETTRLLLSPPEELKTEELYRYVQYQKANGIEAKTYDLALWQRLFLPLTTSVMFLLALPFVFGTQRNNSQGRKLFIGIMIGLAYFISYTSIANIILLTGVSTILGAILPIVLFALLAFVLLWRYA